MRLISDIATTTWQTRQRNGILPSCAKGPLDVQNAVRAVEKSVTNR